MRAYNAADGAKLWHHSFEAGLFTVSIHPNGERVTCAGSDGVLRRFALKDGAAIDQLAVLPGGGK